MVLLSAMRPTQWVKNLFIFGPLIFSQNFGNAAAVFRSTAGFALFCMVSSAGYILNDIRDAEFDRKHPAKRTRPIASGKLSVRNALLFAACLAVASLALSAWLDLFFALFAVCYLVLAVCYSYVLKRVVIVDVLVIAAGFVLRILAGSVAVNVSPSHWLVLCTILLSLFLGFTKRRAELGMLREEATDHRSVLEQYSPAFLDQMISISTATTLVCYILYTVDTHTVTHVAGGGRGLLLTVPFVMYGIFRYLYLVYHREGGDNPTTALLNDRMLLLAIGSWIVVCMLVVYYPDYFKRWFSR